MTMEPHILSQFEPVTGTWQYIVSDDTGRAAIIDPVLDFDPATQTITTTTADKLLSVIESRDYKIDRILETHIHADHLTAASYLQRRLSGIQSHRPPIGVGKRIHEVQSLFGDKYGVPTEEYEEAFQDYFVDDEEFALGDLSVRAIHLPGHTPDHMGYKIGDNVFAGDSLFHTDIGSARCDFPGGSANDLYRSARRLLLLPIHTKIWTGHDYPSERDAVPFLTVQDHLKRNKHFKDNATEADYVAARQARDEQMGTPRLLHHALQFNIRAGRLPKKTDSGDCLFHVPLKIGNASGVRTW